MKHDAALSEAVEILREQDRLLAACLTRFGALRTVLVESPSGHGVTEAVAAAEPLLLQMEELLARQERFLKDKGTARMLRFLVRLTASDARAAALRLALRVAEQEKRLRAEVAGVRALLGRSRDFIAFNINVLTQVRANETYVPPGASETENARGIKMFDANI